MHHTALLLLGVLAVEILSRMAGCRPATYRSIRWLLVTSIFTHHVRDAWRRGLDLQPILEEPLHVPYVLYVIIVAVWPLLLRACVPDVWATGEKSRSGRNAAHDREGDDNV